MRTWAAKRQYANGSIGQFRALADQVSGDDLGAFFDTWLLTSTRPAATAANGFPAGFSAQPGTAPRSLAKILDARKAAARR